MFQSFDTPTRPEQGPPRLALLRDRLAQDGLDAFLVPRADAHQGEYVAPADARLEWLTGFTGSAGMAVVTRDATALFVDGRYRIQGRAQVADEIAIRNLPGDRPEEWLAHELQAGGRVGFDPWLHTAAEIRRFNKALEARDIALLPVDNPLDAVWTDRPPPPSGKAEFYPDRLAGATAAAKRQRIAGILRDAGHAWAVLTLPDSICWLLNIRGHDIPRIPVVQSFALIEADTARVRLFVDPAKVAQLTLDGVDCLPADGLLAALATLSGPVHVDPATAPFVVLDTLNAYGVAVAEGDDPCILPKAVKTNAELAATRTAHLRDGAALCGFLCWLHARTAEVAQGRARLTEIDVVTKLEEFRRQTGALRDISFDTIAGSGPNGAIVHYRVTRDSDRALQPGDLLLVDSGGQYLDGTTDITRTIAVGDPDADQIAAYTRVLQGLIAVSRARFPKGLAGRDLDALARAPLWMAGQDYDHGTGHGVGVYLSVHEGPQRLSRIGETTLRPGMILSNEPGYYRDGEWGIRIENLVAVQQAPDLSGADAGRAMLAFETLTWVPLDRRLINASALSADETAWIDGYHVEIAEKMRALVPAEVVEWLAGATAPL
ncbi:peptidase M24 [Oceaniovalibus guishaninsula JLT2003]|uniref:Peptidase M24 n=1 Tax=Oceaniovalibus guishaninsula JLT2003 TaxID=1231392 RepID=K2HG57_9RHOB|nr:aminopeptidase P family protein [Oceaniovalibus guishaninsula]EKE45452.1 peptidase M24 [Oceaniovalibus guishaninsula JLT2003]